MRMPPCSVFLFPMALLLMACGKKPAHRPVTPAFFYWQTSFRLSAAELRYLDSLNCRKLYIKVLDLGRDPESGEIRPLARLEMADSSGLAGREIVPCVFMTNNVFQNLPATEIEHLAERVMEVILSTYFIFGPSPDSPSPSPRINPTPSPSPEGEGSSPRGEQTPLPFGGGAGGGVDARREGRKEGNERRTAGVSELQFDCDWTPSTREAYFAFLREIKKRLPDDCRLSATIRLHQYKFPARTGVPPADRGLLMLYNTGNIDDPTGRNSIFGAAEARKYLEGAPADYPLNLDLALPVFRWALVYRDDELWKIIPGLDMEQMADTGFFQLTAPPDRASGLASFLVRRGTFRSGFYLRPGDWVRLESVPPNLLAEAARLAAKADLADDATLVFFHLDSMAVQRYPVQTLQMVWQEFSRSSE